MWNTRDKILWVQQRRPVRVRSENRTGFIGWTPGGKEMNFTDRQWNQIRAALAFWNAVAESSRVHPMEHPAVQKYFGDDKPTPLAISEIEAVLLAPTARVTDPVTTITIASKDTGISRERLWRQLRKMGVEPCVVHGKTYLYSAGDMSAAIIACLDKPKRKRHVEPKTP